MHIGPQGSETARQNVLSMANSLSDVLSIVPGPYQEILRAPLRELGAQAAKWVGVQMAIDNLERHSAKGTWPPSILGIHFPKFEVTSGFASTQPEMQQTMHEEWETYRSTTLANAIVLKKAERDWFDVQLAPNTYYGKILSLIEERIPMVAEAHQTPTFSTVEGQTTLDGWVESKTAKVEAKNLVADLPHMCARVVLLEKNRYLTESSKRAAKEQLKSAADVEMGDDTSTSKAISDIVRKELAEAFKKANLTKVRVPDLISDTLSHAPLGKRKWSEATNAQRKAARWEGKEGRSQAAKQEAGSTEGPPAFWEQLRQTAGQQASPFQQKQGKAAEAIVAAATLRYDIPASYPDEILLISPALAIRYLLRSVSPAVLEASRFRGGVHLGPGVIAPLNICIHISAGLKYLTRGSIDPRLLYSAYDDFCDRLRWRLYWTTEVSKGNAPIKPYDPDYEFEHERNSCTFKIDYVEDGLAKGRTFIDNFVETVVPALQAQTKKPNLVEYRPVLRFLKDNDYLVLPTDKNLGSSIVTRQWFLNGVEKLLSDTNSYECIDNVRRNIILATQRKKITDLSDLARVNLGNDQLSNFLRSKLIPEDEPRPRLPVFYGIPKIHKKPTKMRPIVPCHSAMQNPAAKYVSKHLKPMLEKRPFILKGTKDLACALSEMQFVPGRKMFLVSYDIVAFYPNVPTNTCLDEIRTWWKEEMNPSTIERVMMRQAMNVSSLNLIFEFREKTYLQKNGLAMGVASSPDIANLFAAKYEEKVLPHPKVPFYKRFIDDGFSIVYASSAEEALTLMKSLIKIGEPPLELTWEVSERVMPFLDMLVYIEPATGCIQWKPYRKARNHLERIPFASHHPLDIKKGTLLGEMSRMATLSSNAENYLDALKDLRSIYLSRGYPERLLNAWLKEYTAIRWRNRLSKPENVSRSNDRDDPSKTLLVLKSEFNPIWEAFDIHELSRVIVNRWTDHLVDYKSRMSRLYQSGHQEEAGYEDSGSPPVDEPSDPDGPSYSQQIPADNRGTGGRSKKALAIAREGASSFNIEEVITSPSSSPVVTPSSCNDERDKTKRNLDWDEISFEILRRLSYYSNSLEFVRVLDVSAIGLTTARWLVSRKKSRNLADIFNQHKTHLLRNKEEDFDLDDSDTELGGIAAISDVILNEEDPEDIYV
jgi:hypothetical protein